MRTIVGCAAAALLCSCWPFGGGPSGCKTAHDCDATQRCVNSVCKGSSESPGLVGDSCTATPECGSGLTCDSPANGFPNGFCTASCGASTCASGACAALSAGSTCAATCTTDTDCRNGYGCCPGLGNVCVPPVACLPAACSRPIAASTAPAPQILLHQQHKTGDPAVQFNVPAGTASLTIIHQAQIANLSVVFKGRVVDNSAVPGVIHKPDGSRAYDDNDPAFAPTSSPDGGTDPSGLYSFFGGDAPSTGAFTIPNTTAGLNAGVPAGKWDFTVNDYAYECAQPGSGCTDGGVAGNTYDVTVLAKPATPATSTLDVSFYIVADVTTNTGQTLNASTATTDLSVQRMVSTFKSFYSAAGITIGTVSFYDVSAADRARFGTHVNADLTGPCDELDQMFLLSSAHQGNTLNLFLVQSITSKTNGGGSVVGIDGTIPGPASFGGTVHSGAAVSIADLFVNSSSCAGGPNLACGADEVAFIAAHEAGHFLGLFHTTEAEGADFDPITDTPKCPCISCASSTDLPRCATGSSASNPIFIKANQCTSPNSGCGGGDNLMFWQLEAPASQGVLTTQQGAIMRMSPVVH